MFAEVAVLLYAGHLAADYPGQTDHQACRKADRTAQGWRANIAHAATHVLLSVLLLGLGALVLADVVLSPGPVTLALAWVGFSHGLIDRRRLVAWWMKHAGQQGFAARGGAAHVDQAAHVLLGLIPAALLIAALSPAHG